MIGCTHPEVLAERQLYLAPLYEPVEEAGGQCEVLSYVIGLYAQQMRIFVTHGKGTGGAGREDHPALLSRLPDGVDVHFSLPASLLTESVGDQRHAAALLLLQQMDTIACCIHDLHEVLSQLREVIIDVTAVEIAYMFPVSVLLWGSIALEPGLELPAAVGREAAMLVNPHHAVEHRLDRFQAQGSIHYGCDPIRHRTDKVSIRQHPVAQDRTMCAVFDA